MSTHPEASATITATATTRHDGSPRAAVIGYAVPRFTTSGLASAFAVRLRHESRIHFATAKSPTLQAVKEAGVNVQCRTSPNPLERIDVVLTCDHDEDIAFLVSHSKRAMRVIRQNVALALTTKLAFLIFAIFGAAPLWLAVVADTGATVVVTLNGLRLLRASN